MSNQPIEEKCRKVAEKIVDLTGYGQALHVNDILPDLRELIENLLEQEKRRNENGKHFVFPPMSSVDMSDMKMVTCCDDSVARERERFELEFGDFAHEHYLGCTFDRARDRYEYAYDNEVVNLVDEWCKKDSIINPPVEEMPQMKGTMEALDKLSIINK